jgi:hypothetical protein
MMMPMVAVKLHFGTNKVVRASKDKSLGDFVFHLPQIE